MEGSAASDWAEQLATWGIPAAILDQAPQSPWIHPVQSFRPEGDLAVDTPSRHRALEALLHPGGNVSSSVLDVGCGGGRAAFGLTPPAAEVVGVDHQAVMLTVFTEEAERRGVGCSTVLGDWPAVAASTPRCTVAVCHHVAYNVADLVPFLVALSAHAERRVVLELPLAHPLSVLSGMWKHFWGLDRPTRPTAHDAHAVAREAGFDARIEMFETAAPAKPVSDQDVMFTRIRLCLPAERDPEVRAYLEAHPAPPRQLAAIWWDL